MIFVINDFQNLKKKIKKQIESIFKNYKNNGIQDIINLKNNVINIIETNLDEKFEKISQEKIIKSKQVPKISNSIEVFTSEEIQSKNKKITSEFQKISYDYYNDDDENENSSIAEFLIEVANISRKAFIDSNEYLKKVYNDFENEQKDTTIISSKEQFKKFFSSWVKKNNIIENLFDNQKINLNFIDERDKKKIKYFNKLYNDLLALYFQCAIN